MKTEATIREQMQKLRSYIHKASDGAKRPSTRFALAMETALQWVTEDCEWTLMSSVTMEAELFDEAAEKAGRS